jgi:hypothetical protein
MRPALDPDRVSLRLREYATYECPDPAAMAHVAIMATLLHPEWARGLLNELNEYFGTKTKKGTAQTVATVTLMAEELVAAAYLSKGAPK